MTTTSAFGIPETVSTKYTEVLSSVRKELEAKGLGEVDIQRTLLRKLGVDIRRHEILSRCNPSLAPQALHAEPETEPLCPCNVIAPEDDERKAVMLTIGPAQCTAGTGKTKPVVGAVTDGRANLVWFSLRSVPEESKETLI
jgi:uncharacterized protein (DUF302 family)